LAQDILRSLDAVMPFRRAAGGSNERLPARGEFVVRGARVLSMDERIGDFTSGDVHVRDGAIVGVGVGPGLSSPGAEVIDGKGMICMPGFVDTHWHHWTTSLRP
jgi:5-methylthioadenosine/S-adenosylhomocysteine deaminase